MRTKVRPFLRIEEFLHSLTHGAGALLGCLFTYLLYNRCMQMNITFGYPLIIYGVSIILLYLCSFTYHFSCYLTDLENPPQITEITARFDHCAIFLLIIGTYFPPCINNFPKPLGYVIIGIVGACSVIGIILNSINVDRFAKISLVLYIISGWTIGLAIVPFINYVGVKSFVYLLLGGVSYTVGIIFYKLKRVPYMHVIWHLFVLLGTFFHFLMIYNCCL